MTGKEKERENHGAAMAQSPDLNLIEMLWWYLGESRRSKYLQTSTNISITVKKSVLNIPPKLIKS